MDIDLSKEAFEKLYEDNINEMDKEFLKGSVEFLRGHINEESKKYVTEEHGKNGVFWINGHHHYWGMYIRNSLREVGFLDEKLPQKNWDDYYVPVIEIALGLRQVEGI